jgi:hypothetical protein
VLYSTGTLALFSPPVPFRMTCSAEFIRTPPRCLAFTLLSQSGFMLACS